MTDAVTLDQALSQLNLEASREIGPAANTTSAQFRVDQSMDLTPCVSLQTQSHTEDLWGPPNQESSTFTYPCSRETTQQSFVLTEAAGGGDSRQVSTTNISFATSGNFFGGAANTTAGGAGGSGAPTNGSLWQAQVVGGSGCGAVTPSSPFQGLNSDTASITTSSAGLSAPSSYNNRLMMLTETERALLHEQTSSGDAPPPSVFFSEVAESKTISFLMLAAAAAAAAAAGETGGANTDSAISRLRASATATPTSTGNGASGPAANGNGLIPGAAAAAVQNGTARTVDVFLGQLSHTYTTRQVQFLVNHICGCDAVVKIKEGPNNNCCFVTLLENAADRLLAMNKRILCDVDRIWIATNDEDAQFLRDSAARAAPARPKGLGIPKSVLVVERARGPAPKPPPYSIGGVVQPQGPHVHYPHVARGPRAGGMHHHHGVGNAGGLHGPHAHNHHGLGGAPHPFHPAVAGGVPPMYVSPQALASVGGFSVSSLHPPGTQLHPSLAMFGAQGGGLRISPQQQHALHQQQQQQAHAQQAQQQQHGHVTPTLMVVTPTQVTSSNTPPPLQHQHSGASGTSSPSTNNSGTDAASMLCGNCNVAYARTLVKEENARCVFCPQTVLMRSLALQCPQCREYVCRKCMQEAMI